VRFIAGKIGSVAGDGSAVLQVGFVLAATAAAMWAGVVVRGKLRRRDRAPGVRSPEDLGPVAAAFERVEHALAARGRARGAPETAREFVARSADLQRAGIRAALEAFERERYGAEPPPRDAARSAVRELDRIAQALGTSERTTSPPP
jgi:hypothetical protein